MRVVKVSKISMGSFNQLVDLGFVVELVQQAPQKSVFAKYEYNRTIKQIPVYRTKTAVKYGDYSCVVCGTLNCVKCK